jgi:hypothetical protein
MTTIIEYTIRIHTGIDSIHVAIQGGYGVTDWTDTFLSNDAINPSFKKMLFFPQLDVFFI